MSLDDGGPEFYYGMTLRDHFAGLAMQSLIGSFQYGSELRQLFDRDSAVANAGDSKERPADYLARMSYNFADVMLKERAKP